MVIFIQPIEIVEVIFSGEVYFGELQTFTSKICERLFFKVLGAGTAT